MKTLLRFSLLALVSLFMVSCTSTPGSDSPLYGGNKTVYNNFNIHVGTSSKSENIASYANYTDPGDGHWIVEIGTPLTITSYRRGFVLNLKDGRQVYYEYNEGRMGMPLGQYFAKLFSAQPVSTDGYSSIDKQGIKAGKAMKGMSKDGVMAALGYPAAHRTPSLAANEWIYWQNRFATIAVQFDSNGKVTNIVD